MTHAAVGWADLLQVLDALPETRWCEAAAALGFQLRDAVRPVPAPVVAPPVLTAPAPAPEPDLVPEPPPPAGEERQVFWRVASDLPNPDAVTEAPSWYTQTLAPDPAAFQSAPGVPEPSLRPLARPAQLAAFFRRHLTRERPTAEPDVPRILRHIVRQEPLRRWPLRLRHRWPARVHLVYDRSPAIYPLQNDLAPMARQLRRLLGPRLDLLLADGAPEGLCDGDEQPARLAADGGSVVVIGDAGRLNATSPAAAAWSAWAARREATGRRPLVLAPLPTERVDAALVCHADVCPLAATGALRLATTRRSGATSTEPDITALRAALFGNSFVTPALLRDLRLLLQRAGYPLDAAAEALLWRSPVVGASSVACTLRPEQRDTAAADLRRLPPELRSAIAAQHWHHLQAASPLVRAEYVRWLRPELPDDSPLAADFDRALQQAEQLMQQACLAMRDDPLGLGRDLAAYVGRLAHRSASLIEAGEDALQAAWMLAHRDRLQSGQTKPLRGLNLDRLQWLQATDPASAPPAAIYVTMRRPEPSSAPQPVLTVERWDTAAPAGSALAQFQAFGLAQLHTVVDGQRALRLAVGWLVAVNQLLRREDIYARLNQSASRWPDPEQILHTLYAWVEVALQLACSDFDRAWDQDKQIELLLERWVGLLPLLGPSPEDLDQLTLELAALAGRIDRQTGRTRDALLADLAHALAQQIPSECRDLVGFDVRWLTSSRRTIQVGDAVPLHPDLPIEIRAGGRRVVLEPFHKPAWMRVLSFEQGQWTGSVADQVNPVRWQPRANLHTLDKSLPDGVPLPHGAWWTRLQSTGELPTGFILAKPDWASRHGVDQYGRWAEFDLSGRTGPVTQRLRWIPPGEFWMGSPEAEAERTADDDYAETLHRVVLTQGYWLADTACTQALWEAVVGESPSRFKGDPNLPAEQVSWNDVKQKFLPALNRLVPGLEAQLPSEAQWEYACRAGTQTPFWFGEQITTEQVNYDGNYPYAGGSEGEYRNETVAVKSLPANGWGLYEMHGNVYEWCEDVRGDYPKEAVVDPQGPRDGVEGCQRVLRGGSWNRSGRSCRSAGRYTTQPAGRSSRIGFRLARGLGAPPPASVSNKPDPELQAKRGYIARSMEILVGETRKPSSPDSGKKGRGGRSGRKK